MTIHDAAVELQYDVCLIYIEDVEGEGWVWDINGGYSSVGGRHIYESPEDAKQELEEFLKTFKGFEK